MAAYDLEEQEQIEELKTWWRLHGNRVTAMLLAVALALAGWQGWNWWQRNQSAQAATVFFALQQAASEGNAQRVRELAGELIDKYPRTAQAGLAVLLSARVQVDKGENKNAKAQLQWAADHADDVAVRELAHLRLAAILLDEKSYEEAGKHLAATPTPVFAARHAELQGDLLAAQGKLAEAAAAYRSALDHLESKKGEKTAEGGVEQGAYREVVQSKLEALGGEK